MRSPLLITPTAWVRRRIVAHLPGVDLDSPLRGKTIVVTGASSGIGEATALAVAERGAVPLLVARRADRLARVVEEIERRGGHAYAYPCDLTEGASLDALVTRMLDEHEAIDMLVNNAGRSIRRSLALSHHRAHDFERTMAINYLAPVRLILGLLPHMVERRSGHVVNVLTWGVQVKAPKFAAYISSKTALDSFSRIAGRETYGDGVTFTNVRLSLVRTDMIGPTDTYRTVPALSPEQAAAKIVRALEDRPLTISTAVGNISEVANLLAPRLSDAISHRFSKMFPDSPAATRHTATRDADERPNRSTG